MNANYTDKASVVWDRCVTEAARDTTQSLSERIYEHVHSNITSRDSMKAGRWMSQTRHLADRTYASACFSLAFKQLFDSTDWHTTGRPLESARHIVKDEDSGFAISGSGVPVAISDPPLRELLLSSISATTSLAVPIGLGPKADWMHFRPFGSIPTQRMVRVYVPVLSQYRVGYWTDMCMELTRNGHIFESKVYVHRPDTERSDSVVFYVDANQCRAMCQLINKMGSSVEIFGVPVGFGMETEYLFGTVALLSEPKQNTSRKSAGEFWSEYAENRIWDGDLENSRNQFLSAIRAEWKELESIIGRA